MPFGTMYVPSEVDNDTNFPSEKSATKTKLASNQTNWRESRTEFNNSIVHEPRNKSKVRK